MKLSQRVIDKYFNDNPYSLVQHHLDTCDEFYENGIKQIFRENNPIQIGKLLDKESNDFALKCDIFIGGQNGNNVFFGKPLIYDPSDRKHFMYPNKARLRNMTYGVAIHYDVDVVFNIKNGDTYETETTKLEKIFLGIFPIMLMSKLCILRGLDPIIRFELGECKNDKGGYFIIDGKEKCIVSQEKFADNMIYLRDSVDENYSHSSEIRSVSEDASKPMRKMSVKIVSPSPTCKNGQIVISVPNVRKPVPLFILMRALGVISDKEIIEHSLLDIDKNKHYVDLFIPSIHDANRIFNQEVALKYIATFTKGKTVHHVLEILSDYFLPHVGETNFIDKAYFVGYMVKELLKVYLKEAGPTDRDSFQFKRVELPGVLMYNLFKEYFALQHKNIFTKIDKEFYYKQSIYTKDFKSLITMNHHHIFSERIVEQGFKKAFKGNWGSQSNTKRLGVVQDLNRLTFNSALSHLRKINLPLDASAKVIGPRLLHSSQWGMIDPVDTPDGGNVGLHKHMAISAKITSGHLSGEIINWLRVHVNLRFLVECEPMFISNLCKVFVNGKWIGVIGEPKKSVIKLKLHRRCALIPIYTSISWNIKKNTILIYTDSGRICRPLFYVEQGEPSCERASIVEKIQSNNFSWEELITGFTEKKTVLNHQKVFDNISDIYDAKNIYDIEEMNVVEYLDTSETETSLIAMHKENIEIGKHTHLEIHPSLIFGVMGNQVVFPENNQLPRDLFACGQMRQAVSLYHSNYQNRIDKMGVVLNNGQIPLVKSRYLAKINNEEHPYGENVIVAVMCYGGYNVEDSILFNEGSVKRGMFRTTYYNMYESFEERVSVGDSNIDSKFIKINEDVVGTKPGYDYSELNDDGLIKENTELNEKKVIIGKVVEESEYFVDSSTFPKKGQMGFVDKAFVTENDEGYRIAKVRVRDERIPSIGDKFCSRCGQKGTIGLLIPEENMPFTEEGLRPDIIVNPHAFPSRMTIGQLVESLMGKACSIYGGFGDCTAFMNKGSKHKEFGDMLLQSGYHSSGCEVMYNGESGEQIDAEIYCGPTYYMRLKHMVKDKINYRARGPRTALTRQTVSGRANDGGLRIGEMERDGILAHGATRFLQESMLERGDEYFMAVCNKTGMIAIYNESKNLFISPQADGPIKFQGNINDDEKNVVKKTEFGRSFSVVRIPYAFKLLIHELQAMNVQMRVITEDNIQQISSKKTSNIIKLLGNDMTPDKIAFITQNTKDMINNNGSQERNGASERDNIGDGDNYNMGGEVNNLVESGVKLSSKEQGIKINTEDEDTRNEGTRIEDTRNEGARIEDTRNEGARDEDTNDVKEVEDNVFSGIGVNAGDLEEVNIVLDKSDKESGETNIEEKINTVNSSRVSNENIVEPQMLTKPYPVSDELSSPIDVPTSKIEFDNLEKQGSIPKIEFEELNIIENKGNTQENKESQPIVIDTHEQNRASNIDLKIETIPTEVKLESAQEQIPDEDITILTDVSGLDNINKNELQDSTNERKQIKIDWK